MAKRNRDHTRHVLETLEHEIVPFVKQVRDSIAGLKGLANFDVNKIVSAIDNLEKKVTKLVLKEMNKKRNSDKRGVRK